MMLVELHTLNQIETRWHRAPLIGGRDGVSRHERDSHADHRLSSVWLWGDD